MTICTRLRAPILFMRLARWNLPVLRLMWSSSAISALVRPWATVKATSSSRSVMGDDRLSALRGGCRVGQAGEQTADDAGGDEGVRRRRRHVLPGPASLGRNP